MLSAEATRTEKMLKRLLKLRENNSLTHDFGVLTKSLVFTNLPHRTPPRGETYMRQNGRYKLEMTADNNGLLPAGAIPRLLLVYICTYAFVHKTKNINLGRNLSQFLRTLGLDPNTGRGRCGDAKRFKEQFNRLVRCSIYVWGTNNSADVTDLQDSFKLFKRASMFWNTAKDEQTQSLIENEIEITQDFYELILNSHIPLDLDSLKALKTSSMAVDLYMFFNYRVMVVKKPDGDFIPYASLMKQMGGSFSDRKDFKKAIKKHLPDLKQVWPELDCETVDGGILIQRQKTHMEILHAS